jgi:hypothetical protein
MIPRRLVAAYALAAVGCAAAVLAPTAAAEPEQAYDDPAPCRGDQLAVSASPTQAAVGHRSLNLTFALASGAAPCTLTGYPAVDSGAGGPLLHARPTPRGYMGGLPAGVDKPPIVALSLSQRAQAIVEGTGIDGAGNPCPNYTDLLVNPPNTSEVFTVPAAIDACQLQVHPITEAQPATLPG